MNFVDQVKLIVKAGDGGNGHRSFRREKFISRGGPDGGDGGKGGDVILRASPNTDSLAAFRYNKVLNAAAGQAGGNNKKHGKSGQDLVVPVPVGTEAKDQLGNLVADLVTAGQAVVVAKGGRGGFGNAHFVSSTRQSPDFAEKGEPGLSIELTLELKMLADVGLVGLPNAGKSTLLGAISKAKPKVADYPFTTLTPSVGVVDVDQTTSLLVADIPGLIEGAAGGKGLGHDFLRHIERTAVIMHLIDAYTEDPVRSYRIIRTELAAYAKALAKRPEIVVITKVEGMDKATLNSCIQKLKAVIKPKTTPILAISAKANLGLNQLLAAAVKAKHQTAKRQKAKSTHQVYEYTLPDDPKVWHFRRSGRKFIVSGTQLERFASQTDFGNPQAVARLVDILNKRGVVQALLKAGLSSGDIIDINGRGKIRY